MIAGLALLLAESLLPIGCERKRARSGSVERPSDTLNETQNA